MLTYSKMQEARRLDYAVYRLMGTALETTTSVAMKLRAAKALGYSFWMPRDAHSALSQLEKRGLVQRVSEGRGKSILWVKTERKTR